MESKCSSVLAIKNAVEGFFIQDDWSYKLAKKDETFLFNSGVEFSKQSLKIEIGIIVKPDFILVREKMPIKVDKSSIAAVVEFLTRANYGLRNGNFEFDYDDLAIFYKTFINCSENAFNYTVIKDAIYVAASMIKKYSEGIQQVIKGKVSPCEAIEAAEKDFDQKEGDEN